MQDKLHKILALVLLQQTSVLLLYIVRIRFVLTFNFKVHLRAGKVFHAAVNGEEVANLQDLNV